MSQNPELAFIETFDNQLTEFDGSMLKKLKFLHIDYNRLTYLDMSRNPALEGNGFVAANNQLTSLTLPNIPDFTVEAAVFCEQNPRTGYDRAEWYLDPAYTQPIRETDLLPARGQTVYARWVPNPYTIYYRPNGGAGSMEPQPAVYGDSFALRPNGFARVGYTFAGWNTYADGTGGRAFREGETVRDLAGQNGSRDTVLLYAQWTPNAYAIRYNGNGGEGGMAGTDARYDQPVTLPESGFVWQGHTFLGWAASPNAAQPDYFPGETVQNLTAENGGAVELYAVWIEETDIQAEYLRQLDAL